MAKSAGEFRNLPDVLTLREAAGFLRLSERRLYDLARARRVPAAQLGGKWLFPRAALERWLLRAADPEGLLAAAATPGPAAGGPAASPPPIIAGSHDPLLDWAVRQSGCGLALRAGGSLDGLDALARGEAAVAATHLRDPDSGEFNRPAACDALGAVPGEGVVGLVWAWREQGLILPPGNPLGLATVADLARPGVRVIGRQRRAGSHLALLHLLAEAGLRLEQVAFLPEPALAEDEVAAAVAEGRAEAGFGIRAEAEIRGLAFVPLLRERFDLVMRLRTHVEPPVQALLAFARGAAFRARAARLGGYDVAATGTVAFVI
ncbi:helix-turn-helix transcriptional regulator [Caldovatus aquaticus]|uniref:Helix-turn-helix transcriptional regulator n=1 Tax=Caldovatus aquaticus TaxID=2865671 RepID=A0ABS7F4T3_9PROT|nr:helix-turn-helix transcriptional regulator [Caldovatus aquaticus]MBW8270633.1 helix-turn-helix transcriptional regulator [Caldovatus aquaticus]